MNRWISILDSLVYKNTDKVGAYSSEIDGCSDFCFYSEMKYSICVKTRTDSLNQAKL